jgi:hypothetical protein
MKTRLNKLHRINLAALISTLVAAPLAFAQDTESSETIASYSAGYKAAFTCSATFNSNKSPEQIAKQELTGIYPAYQEVVNSLPPAQIDYENKRVSVEFSESLPPRVSVWRPHLGCAQLPTGASIEDVHLLPSINLDKPVGDDNAPWTKRAPINGSSGNTVLDRVVEGAFRGDRFNTEFGADAYTTAILIATPDAILAEHYIDGYDHKTSQRTWSVAKSIAATVMGAAVQQGHIDVKQPTQIAAWQSPLDPRRHITTENLLHMGSGLDSNRAGNRTDRLYTGGGRVIDTAVTNSLEIAPGTRWKYANNDTLLAMHALRAAMNDDSAYQNLPFEQVLYKIGMLDTYLETDWNGDFIMSSQVWTTSRDLARLGTLYLNDGVWNGERLLPEGWAEYVASPAPAQPGGGATGYGAQFWLCNERSPNIPNDTYAAQGNRGQILMIIPSENLLIIRRGHDPAGGRGFRQGAFTEAVLEALSIQ